MEEKPLQTTDEFGFDLKTSYDALFVLFGTSNQGKTSTLFRLIYLLGRKSKNVDTKSVSAFIKQHEKVDLSTGRLFYSDVRIVIPYQGKQIAIATFGDYREVCETNMSFFRRKEVPFFFYDGIDFVSSDDENLTKQQKVKLKKVKPTIFISACRTEGGAVDAMEYCSHFYLKQIARIIWIRKKGKNPEPTKVRVSPHDKKYANDLIDAINGIIKGKTI